MFPILQFFGEFRIWGIQKSQNPLFLDLMQQVLGVDAM
jgi:hypothetical protein